MTNEETGSFTVSAQHRVGAALVALSLTAMLIAGLWLSADSLAGVAHWSGVALVQSVYAALVAYFLFTVLRKKYAVSFPLVFGVLLTGLVAYDLPSAYRDNQRRVDANEAIIGLRDGSRDLDDLLPQERDNPYVEAFVAMREIFQELRKRADARVSPYRAAYEDSVRSGAFLDTQRLDTVYEVWYSYAKLYELEDVLRQATENRLDASDLLWRVNSFPVDAGTRATYANDLRTSANIIEKTQAAFLEQEWETLAQTRQSLEVLIDANGHYRIQGAQIIFDDPELSIHFPGKSTGGQ